MDILQLHPTQSLSNKKEYNVSNQNSSSSEYLYTFAFAVDTAQGGVAAKLLWMELLGRFPNNAHAL